MFTRSLIQLAMNRLLSIALASFFVSFLPSVIWATNPPPDDFCKDNPSATKCKCPPPGGASNGSLSYSLQFGGLPFSDEASRSIVLHSSKPHPILFTPQGLQYTSRSFAQLVGDRRIPGPNTIESDPAQALLMHWEFQIINEHGRLVTYQVNGGQVRGLPVRGEVEDYGTLVLSAIAKLGTHSVTTVRLEYADSSYLEFNYSTRQRTAHRTKSGRNLIQGIPTELNTGVVRENGVLRQIRAPQGLADIVPVADQAYEIRLYTPDQVGAQNTQTQIYDLVGDPYRVVRFENDTGDPERLDRMRITDTWGTREKVNVFEYDEEIDQWLLSLGDGVSLRSEKKLSYPGPEVNETSYLRTLENEQNQVVSKALEVFRTGRIVLKVQEPDTLNLAKAYDYHTSGNGVGKLKSMVEPTGYWETYSYDPYERLVETVTPWMDTEFANASTGPRAVTAYSYSSNDNWYDIPLLSDARPRTIIKSIIPSSGASPIVTEKTFYLYKKDNQGVYSEVEEIAHSPSAVFGASGNLRTTRVYHTTLTSQAGYDALYAGLLHYVDYPDGTRTVFNYSRNSSDLSAYYTVTESRVTSDAPAGVDGLSTRIEKIHNVRGDLVQMKSSIRSGGQWHLVSTELRTVNGQGFHVATHVDGRQVFAGIYDADFLVSRTSEDGGTTVTSYDALDKIDTETKQGVAASGGFAAQPDIVTTYERDLGGLDCGCDGEVLAITTAGTLSLSTETKKDAIGRLTYLKDAAGLETSYTYQLGGRQTTRNNPDGGTYIDLQYIDGRQKSLTGTGTIAEYFVYGVNTDGTTWTRVNKVSETGARWEKHTYNHLGQLIRHERPAQDGGNLATVYLYNPKGQLVRQRQLHVVGTTETPLIADTLNEYDALGNISRTGLDVSGNGTLDLASADRITDTDHTFAQHGSAWWQVLRTKVYPEINSSVAVQVTEKRSRLSGLDASLASETVVLDIDANPTTTTINIDAAAKLVTTTTTSPTSSIPAVRVVRNGLMVSANSYEVEAPTLYGFDDLGRLKTILDPRHENPMWGGYDESTGQLIEVKDADGNSTSAEYYPNGVAGSGQVKLVTDALGQTSRNSYDLLGRLVTQWGGAGYPQAYAYTAHGELATLTTWRDAGATNFDSATWPAPTGGDVTTWQHQASTGLLTRKEYHDTKGTDYGYDNLGRLTTRTWSRQVASLPLLTTYAYSPSTGELVSVDYSDATPDVAIAYDRLGRQATVSDAAGTRTFPYDAAKLRQTTETLPAFFGGRVITRLHQGSGTGQVPGRSAGFQLGSVGDPDEDFAVSYAYDVAGRFSAITSPAGRFDYGYVTKLVINEDPLVAPVEVKVSNLLASVKSPGHDTTYGYEANRDLRTEVRNRVTGGGADRSRFVYLHDDIGRRTSRAQSGSAFGASSYDRFGYNSRSEVTETKRHEGTSPANHATDPETTALRRLYNFDHLGNRLTSQSGTATARAYQTNSLNQYTSISGVSFQPAFDFDGNQTLSETGWRYQWDAENRLYRARDYDVTPVNGSRQIDYTYDYQSRRIRKVVQQHDGSSWQVNEDRKFIYDDWNLIAEYDAQVAGLGLQVSYTWGMDLSGSLQGAGGVGGLLAVTQGSSSYFPTYDANGNVSEYLTSTGAVEAHFQYSAFGDLVGSSGTNLGRFVHRFSTKYFDDGPDLYYYGFRYYNPSTGRWPSRDLIEERGGLNLFGFVYNNPTNLVDTLGLFAPAPVLAPAAPAVANPVVAGTVVSAGLLAGAGYGYWQLGELIGRR